MQKIHCKLSSIFKNQLKYYSSCNKISGCFDKIPNYNLKTKLLLEKYWSDKQSNSSQHNEVTDKKKMYILSMFPYPSGHLHLGHMRVYTTTDVLARYNRLINRDVIFPMGWDSFGLPAENAALERNLEPKIWTKKNIHEMRKQMKEHMSLSIDWKREISTCDPKYFKWTQWLFCRLYENGLAYKRSEMVNWDPVDRTVLAEELIDKDGRSWRSGAKVVKIPLKQWFIRTTALSRSLLDGLEIIKDGQWRHVREEQKGWLGKLQGVHMEFDLVDFRDQLGSVVDRLSVFTSSPVAALSDFVAFVEINDENIWWNYKDSSQPKEDLSYHPYLAVKHPLSGRFIPIVRNRNLKFNEEECLSARLGFPLLDINDAKIAAKLNIFGSASVKLGAYNRIKDSSWSPTEGLTLDSGIEDALKAKSHEKLRQMGRGGYECSKLRTDWLISRQRYWGTPIPIVHCPSCGPVAVPDEQLPVELPPYGDCQYAETDTDIVASPLAKATDWLQTKCPKCGNPDCQRETDTMDTFVDSSWYFLRYLDSSNSKEICSKQSVMENMPVDIYIGGMEHAIRHLFYARFISHFLHFFTDIKLPNGPEPFSQFLPIGLILGKTFVSKSGKYVFPQNVRYRDETPFDINTGDTLTEYWDKMSKSKNNGISPKSVVDKYGLDTTRLIILSNTGPDKTRKWQENDVVVGVQAWEVRIWNLIKHIVQQPSIDIDSLSQDDHLIHDEVFIQHYQNLSRNVRFHYSSTFTISVVIANMQKLTSILLKMSKNEKSLRSIMFYRTMLNFLVYMYPLSPLLTSELWAHLSAFLVPLESVFVDTDGLYNNVLGHWNFDLNSPVWNQKFSESLITEISQKFAEGHVRS